MIQDESREVPVNDYTRGRFSDVNVVAFADVNLIRIGYVHPSHWVPLRIAYGSPILTARLAKSGAARVRFPGVGKKDVV